MPPPRELKLAVTLGGLRRILFLLTVLCCAISCSCCTQEQLERNDVVSICFPSFKGEVGERKLGYRLRGSWDAGVIDGALHLTTDDVYQAAVYNPPDWRRSAGNVILWDEIELWPPLSTDGVWHEASFNTTFTMSANQSREGDGGGLMFEILPYRFTGFDRATYFSLASASNYLSDGRRVPVEIGRIDYYQGHTGLYVSIAPAPNESSANYTVWIDYNAVVHNLSVYAVEDGKPKGPKPGQATLHAPVNISDIVSSFDRPYFGLFASKNRLLPSCQAVVYSWNLTVDRLPGMGGRRRRRWLAMLLPSLLVVVIAVVVFVAACYFASRYRALKMKLKLSEALRQLPGVPREFKHATIRKATHNFHEAMKLGKGGFGAVYKGTLRSGKRGDVRVEVAVKKFTRKEDRGYDDFLAEVDIINRLRHKNIVPLVGWCYEKGELLLIYEYMPKGSLEQHLFRENHHHQQPTLRWETRYDIVKDVAAGLHYVHHEYERTVLHRDIKASNILLDSAFRGHLGDFGLARVVAFDKNSFTDLGVAGTWGFIAPEYPVSHKATRQTDVYAFGVLVLEVVTGKRSLSAADAAFPLLTDWVWWLHREGRLLEVVDGDLTASGEFDLDDATRLLLLGLACSNPNPSDRPTMVEVVQVIAKSAALPVVPLVKPTFVWPPEGGLPLDDLVDDFVGLGHDASGRSYSEETSSREGVTMNIRASEITKRRCRIVAEPNITGDIESFV